MWGGKKSWSAFGIVRSPTYRNFPDKLSLLYVSYCRLSEQGRCNVVFSLVCRTVMYPRYTKCGLFFVCFLVYHNQFPGADELPAVRAGYTLHPQQVSADEKLSCIHIDHTKQG